MNNDSMPSSQAGLRGPATFRITRVRFSCSLRCEDTELGRFLKVGRERYLVLLGISSAEKEDILVRLDA